MMKTTTNQERIEGVVLKNTPYKENDMIIHIYTQEYGKIGIHGRGLKKLTSKNASSCLSMTRSSMDILLKKGMASLVRSEAIDYYFQIKESIDSEIIANVILEYYYRYVEEKKPSFLHYHFLIKALDCLNQGYSPLCIYLFFLVFVLKQEGIDVEVDHCLFCEQTKVVSISLEGGFVCSKHQQHYPLYEKDVLKAFRHLYKLDIDKIDQLTYREEVMKTLIPLYEYYIEEYAGIVFKSKIFIHQLLGE